MCDSRLRVLMLHQGAELYGSDRVFADVVELVSCFAEPLVVLDSDGPLCSELVGRGVSVDVVHLGTLRRCNLSAGGVVRTVAEILRATAYLTRAVRERRVALVYSSTIGVVSGALAAALTRRPHVWHVHEIIAHPRWLAVVLATAAGRLSTRIICVSNAVAANLAQRSRAVKGKLTVVHNAANPPSLDSGRLDTVRAELGVTDGLFTIAMIGRISSWKGQDYLVDAVALMEPSLLERTRVLIVGDCFRNQNEPLRDLEQRVAALGLESVVCLLGYRRDVAELIAISDVVVVPSTRPEPFGLVAVEAMLLRRPVVGTDHGGLREIVVDGATGFLVPVGKPQLLAARLEQLACDPALGEQMGEAGELRARNRFARRRFDREVREVVLSALGVKPRDA